jgi:hypothetical protein
MASAKNALDKEVNELKPAHSAVPNGVPLVQCLGSNGFDHWPACAQECISETSVEADGV